MDEALASRLRAVGIRDERVVAAMARLDRARFIPEPWRDEAAADRPIPIGEGQTISQPTLVALMTEHLGLAGQERVLEVGTGSGYQAAVLSPLCSELWSLERLPGLAARARALLLDAPIGASAGGLGSASAGGLGGASAGGLGGASAGGLGLSNVHLRCGDGAQGWPEEAPFDRIVVTAAAPEVPPALLAQLAPGGRLLAPVGPAGGPQWLRLLEFGWDGRVTARDLEPVRFVPLVPGEVAPPLLH